MKKIYLHIGLHRTGSTAIQTALRLSKSQLRKQGVLVPEAGYAWGGQHQLAWALLDNNPEWYPVSEFSTVDLFKALRGEINHSQCDKVLISSEDFSLLGLQGNRSKLEELKKYLSDYDVTVVAYLRNQVDYLNSFFHESVKSFDSRFNISGIDAFKSDISQLLDYKSLLKQWADVFGRDSLLVTPYKLADGRIDSVDRFFELIKLDMPAIEGIRNNRSLDGKQFAIKQLINGSDMPSDIKVALGSVMQLASTGPSARSFDTDTAEAVMNQYCEINRSVAEEYQFDAELLNETDIDYSDVLSNTEHETMDQAALLEAATLIGALKIELYRELDSEREQLWNRINDMERRIREVESKSTVLIRRLRQSKRVSIFRRMIGRLLQGRATRAKQLLNTAKAEGLPVKANLAAKHIVFIDHEIPKYDNNAGGRHTLHYMKLFKSLGWRVTFLPYEDCEPESDHRSVLELEGIEVLVQRECSNEPWRADFWLDWIIEHRSSISIVFPQRPHIGQIYMPFCKKLGLKVWYGCIDLHFLRLGRQARIEKSLRLLLHTYKMLRIEKALFRMADVSFTPSMHEEQVIRERFNVKDVVTLPLYICTDIELTGRSQPNNRELVFVGSFDHQPNSDALEWFVKDILPTVCERVPGVVFHVVGKNPPEAVVNQQCEGIVFHGYLSDEDLEQLLDQAYMMVVPLRFGAGVKGKVIDALRKGLPLASTNCGLEGIENVGQVVSGYDQAEAFADEILRLFDLDAKQYSELSVKMKSIIASAFSKEAALEKIEQYLPDEE